MSTYGGRWTEPNGEEAALHIVAAMQRGRMANLDAELALEAAKTSFETKLPMADSVILATAYAYEATLWTQDADFEGMAGVKYVEKR